MFLYSLLRWIINALILMVITYFVPGVVVASFYYALVIVIVLGLINALIRPLIILLTLPINIMSLGLFTFVINALMFWLAASVLDGFVVFDFWSAFLGALIYAVLSMAVSYIDTKATD